MEPHPGSTTFMTEVIGVVDLGQILHPVSSEMILTAKSHHGVPQTHGPLRLLDKKHGFK